MNTSIFLIDSPLHVRNRQLDELGSPVRRTSVSHDRGYGYKWHKQPNAFNDSAFGVFRSSPIWLTFEAQQLQGWEKQNLLFLTVA